MAAAMAVVEVKVHLTVGAAVLAGILVTEAMVQFLDTIMA
jgi:hypothetical protein